jgi:hypothetical protein
MELGGFQCVRCPHRQASAEACSRPVAWRSAPARQRGSSPRCAVSAPSRSSSKRGLSRWRPRLSSLPWWPSCAWCPRRASARSPSGRPSRWAARSRSRAWPISRSSTTAQPRRRRRSKPHRRCGCRGRPSRPSSTRRDTRSARPTQAMSQPNRAARPRRRRKRGAVRRRAARASRETTFRSRPGHPSRARQPRGRSPRRRPIRTRRPAYRATSGPPSAVRRPRRPLSVMEATGQLALRDQPQSGTPAAEPAARQHQPNAEAPTRRLRHAGAWPTWWG